MSATINKIYVQTFERNLRFLAQQEVNRLRPYVTERGVDGINHNWERLGSKEATQKTTRAQATPVADFVFSRRVSIAQTWNIGELTELEDPSQALVDINGGLTQSMGFAMRRAFDKNIIASLGGASLDGDGNAVPYAAGQLIGTGVAPISFDLVTQVQEKFMNNNIMPDEPKVFVVGPVQIRQLMQTTEATSSDYVRRQLDQLSSTGIVPMWMGFTWICSTLLDSSGAGKLYNYAFTKRGIGLQVNRDITANIAQDPSRSFAWSLYCSATFGSTRVEDEQVVKLDLLNS
jgi:Phage capsid protein